MAASPQKNTFYNHFPTPDYLTLSTAGIAVNDEGIHLIQFHHGLLGKGLKLSRYEKIVLPEGLVEAGYINNPEKLTEILKNLSLRYNLSYARMALPEERAYLFTAEIDQVPPEGLHDAVAFIIEQNVPLQLANAVFDFDVLATDEAAGKIKVNVAVLSKKVVDFYLATFEAAGITPVSFDIESQAIARAVVPKGDKSSQLIINLGIKKTGLYVVEDEIVQFTTTLPYGSNAGNSAPHLNDLKTEIRKISNFWEARNKSGLPEKNITKTLLCGAASLDHAFVASLMADSAVPYALANPWTNVFYVADRVPKKLAKDALDYVSAVGLAIPHPHRTYV